MTFSGTVERRRSLDAWKESRGRTSNMHRSIPPTTRLLELFGADRPTIRKVVRISTLNFRVMGRDNTTCRHGPRS